MNVAVEEPHAPVGGAVRDEPVKVVTVTAVREIAYDDGACADSKLDAALPDLVKARFEVAIEPAAL